MKKKIIMEFNVEADREFWENEETASEVEIVTIDWLQEVIDAFVTGKDDEERHYSDLKITDSEDGVTREFHNFPFYHVLGKMKDWYGFSENPSDDFKNLSVTMIVE